MREPKFEIDLRDQAMGHTRYLDLLRLTRGIYFLPIAAWRRIQGKANRLQFSRSALQHSSLDSETGRSRVYVEGMPAPVVDQRTMLTPHAQWYKPASIAIVQLTKITKNKTGVRESHEIPLPRDN